MLAQTDATNHYIQQYLWGINNGVNLKVRLVDRSWNGSHIVSLGDQPME